MSQPRPLPPDPTARIAARIFAVRARKVLLDEDLAELYGVQTKRLNEQVKRNAERFPEDFMFRLTRSELEALNRSQIATGSSKHRDTRFPPFAFTEHGALMAASVLKTSRAVEASIYVMRAFIQLREMFLAHKDLAGKLEELERKFGAHDQAIREIINAIRQMTALPASKKPPIGFVRPGEGENPGSSG
jgi:hypothetical protein